MKGFFVTALLGAPIIAVLLFFALQGKEEVKHEQAVERIEQKIDAAKFDREFAQVWNGRKLSAPDKDEIHKLEAERDRLVVKQDRVEQVSDEDIADLRAALKEMGGKK